MRPQHRATEPRRSKRASDHALAHRRRHANRILLSGRDSGGRRGEPLSRVGSFRWRADPNAYVDVFWGVLSDDGLEYAPMARYEWPSDELTSGTLRQDPPIDILTLDSRVVFDEKLPRSIRFYDRGACSADLSWRQLGEAITEQFDAEVIRRAAEGDPQDPTDCKDLTPISNWIVTPILRDESGSDPRDAFRFSRSYGGTFCNTNIGTTVRFSWTARVFVVDSVLTFSVESVSIVNGFGVHQLADEAQLMSDLPPSLTTAIPAAVGQVVRLGPALPPLLGCAVGGDSTECPEAARRLFEPRASDPRECRTTCFGSNCIRVCRGAIADRNFICVPNVERREGGACAFVPNFSRVNERPEGIETVLSEWSYDEELLGRGEADPLFGLLQVGGARQRSEGTASPVVGYLGSVFEVPPPGAPLPFGDTP